MSSFLAIWRGILANPFTGFAKVTRDTKIAGPLVCLALATVLQVTLLVPVTTSAEYAAAMSRLQLAELMKRAAEMDPAQLEQAQAQLASPGVRIMTVVSSYLGGLLSLVAALFVAALIFKLLCTMVGSQAPYWLLLRILLFAGIVSAAGGLLKAGITLAGDWRGALRLAQSARELQLAIQSPLSLALAFPASSLGKTAYALLDGGTDVFSWIYYVFVYAGLRSSAGLAKPKALAIVLVSGLAFLALAVGATFLF